MGTDIKEANTFRMFVVPDFLFGMASAIDIRGNIPLFNLSSSEYEADFLALKSDWKAIGLDFHKAISEWEEKNAS